MSSYCISFYFKIEGDATIEEVRASFSSTCTAGRPQIMDGGHLFNAPSGLPDQEPLRISDDPTPLEFRIIDAEIESLFGKPFVHIKRKDEGNESDPEGPRDEGKCLVGPDGVARIYHNHKIQMNGTDVVLRNPIGNKIGEVFVTVGLPSSKCGPGFTVNQQI